jgi:hypothetical protein
MIRTVAHITAPALGLVAWEPDIWGKFRAKQAAAENVHEATQMDFLYATQSLAATTAKCWYLAIETAQTLSIARQTVSITAIYWQSLNQNASWARWEIWMWKNLKQTWLLRRNGNSAIGYEKEARRNLKHC